MLGGMLQIDKLGEKPLIRHADFRGIAKRLAHLTINARLKAIVFSLAVPLNLVVIVVIWQLANSVLQHRRTGLVYAARSAATAADAELGKYIALGQVLSDDPALLEESLDAFDDQVRRRLMAVPNTWAVVADLEGHPLIDTAAPHGQPLPALPAQQIAAQEQAFETRSVVVSELYQEPQTGVWMTSATVPIFTNGKPFRSLALTMNVRRFADLLAFREMPKNWLAAIHDQTGRLVARVPDHERWVGQIVKTNEKDGLFKVMSPEGVELIIADAHLDLSNWTVGVGVRQAELRAIVFIAIGWAVAVGGVISLLSLLLAIRIAKQITRPLTELRQKAGRVLTDPGIRFEPDVPELGELWAALSRAAADQQLLIQELNHRTRNMLSVVRSIASQTAASTPADFVERFSQRVRALSASQNLLVRSQWRGIEIDELVRVQLAHFGDLIGNRIMVDGPPLSLTPAAAQSIGMALHELATNAGKYGSLSGNYGSVSIDWRIDGDQFSLRWTEQDGPHVEPPKQRGFGSTIISAAAEASVDGEVELTYHPSGVSWRLRCAASKVLSTA